MWGPSPGGTIPVRLRAERNTVGGWTEKAGRGAQRPYITNWTTVHGRSGQA